MIGVAGALSVSTGPAAVAVLVDEANSTYLSGGGRKNVSIELPPASPAPPLSHLRWRTKRSPMASDGS